MCYNVIGRLQVLCTEWMEACMILLAGLRDSPVQQPGPSTSGDALVCPVSPAADMETPVRHTQSTLVSTQTICHLDVAVYDRSLYR